MICGRVEWLASVCSRRSAMTFEVVVGANWGDEGKGRIVDYLAAHADYVVRFQGGNNAGHTVINEHGEFALHLLPSGIFHPGVVNVLGPGMVIDLEALVEEIDDIAQRGIDPELRISRRATICFPFHVLEEQWEEERLGNAAFGSTGRGISPAYADRTAKWGIQIGELADRARFEKRLAALLVRKQLLAKGVYGRELPVAFAEVVEWSYRNYAALAPRVCDTGSLLKEALEKGRRVLFEAQLGALRDLDLGIYPFTTSSNVLAAYAPIGGGLGAARPDRVTAVVKAFSTCVGAGPFVSRMEEDLATILRERGGGEYGATTGRPREIGHFDAVATRYGVGLQGADRVALTKLDCLSGIDPLKVCVGYRVGDQVLTEFPVNCELERAVPVYRELPGWSEPIGAVREFDRLPKAAREYVEMVESSIECGIAFISTGRERSQLIVRESGWIA